MICHNCGSTIEHFTRFCGTCGAAVGAYQAEGEAGVDSHFVLKTTQMDKPEIRVPRWRLSKMEGVKIPDGFSLTSDTSIGRDPHCDVHLPSPNVSRFHAKVEWSGTGFDIKDLDSTNGTYVNRRLIKEPTRLNIGSTVQIGDYSFLVMKDSTQCGNCRETVRADDRFCQYCGSPLLSEEFQPKHGQTGIHVHEEPFPATTPVPVVQDTSSGLQTPQFITPLPVGLSGYFNQSAVGQPPPSPSIQQRPPSQVAAPPPAPPPPPRVQPKQNRSKQRSYLIIAVILGISLLGLGGIVYFLASSGFLKGKLSSNSSGEIHFTNLSASTVTARLARLDTESGEPEVFGSIELGTLENGGISDIVVGRYQLEISGSPLPGICTLQMQGEDLYEIVIDSEVISIAETAGEPQSPDELNMATSSLCRQ